MDSKQAEVVVAAISRSDAELATNSDLKAEIAGVKADLNISKDFFGQAIIILLLKIAFFQPGCRHPRPAACTG